MFLLLYDKLLNNMRGAGDLGHHDPQVMSLYWKRNYLRDQSIVQTLYQQWTDTLCTWLRFIQFKIVQFNKDV